MKKISIDIDIVEIREDFPNRDEAYALLTDGSRFAFAWGPKYPYEDSVPAQDILDGASGIEWYESEEDARTAMDQAIEAWADTGN